MTNHESADKCRRYADSVFCTLFLQAVGETPSADAQTEFLNCKIVFQGRSSCSLHLHLGHLSYSL